MARPQAQGSHGQRDGQAPSRARPATRPYTSPANSPICWPEITSRCTVPVACRVCQSSRASPAPSPSTRAVSAASRPWASTFISRWRTASRQSAASWPTSSPALTEPVAPIPRANNSASRSGPWGLSSPWGWRRFTARRQRSPARNSGPANQLSCRRLGNCARRDSGCSSSKRTPRSVRVGSPTTLPSNHSVRPSSAGARRSSSACCADQQAQQPPSTNQPSGQARVRRQANASNSNGISHPTGGKAGNKRRLNSPSTSASIPVRMR
ncbi:hypothetical protein ACVWY1_002348 [Pseudomonas sp. TE6288]